MQGDKFTQPSLGLWAMIRHQLDTRWDVSLSTKIFPDREKVLVSDGKIKLTNLFTEREKEKRKKFR